MDGTEQSAQNDECVESLQPHRTAHLTRPVAGDLGRSRLPRESGCLTDCGLPTGRTVDELTEDVGVARMAGSLFEEMADDPAKVGDRLTVGSATELVERRLRDQDVGFIADGAVTTDRSIDRRFVVAHACSVLAGEAPEHPRGFGVCYVVDQPDVPEATGEAAAWASSIPSNIFSSEFRWYASSEVTTARSSPVTRGGFSSGKTASYREPPLRCVAKSVRPRILSAPARCRSGAPDIWTL